MDGFTTMNPILLFIFPIMSLWVADLENESETQHLVLLTDEVEIYCNNSKHINACVRTMWGMDVMIVTNPFGYATKGDTQAIHELYHLGGYEENEIPPTKTIYIPPYMKEKLGMPQNDKDLDMIPDEYDFCPALKEIYNGYRDLDGCPDMVKIR
jgi:hypothetical protein